MGRTVGVDVAREAEIAGPAGDVAVALGRAVAVEVARGSGVGVDGAAGKVAAGAGVDVAVGSGVGVGPVTITDGDQAESRLLPTAFTA